MGHQVRFGNPAPVSVTRDGDEGDLVRSAVETVPEDGAVTEVEIPDGASLVEAFTTITAPGGVWDYHSDDHPTWLSSTHKALAELLKEHFDSKGADVEIRKHDAKVVTVFGDPSVATPAAHRKGLASHAARLGVKGDAVDATTDEEAGS